MPRSLLAEDPRSPRARHRRPTAETFLTKPHTFFLSPEPAGRKIIFGFSYLQRVNRYAHTDLWFPASVQEKIGARVLAGDQSVLDEFRVDWAAVRQFELLQESGNLSIEDLDVTNWKKAFEYRNKMRAGGYRVTVITLGRYASLTGHDDLHILDRRLQDEITRFINMLYLEQQSTDATQDMNSALTAENWQYAEALPHVAVTLGAQNLFKPEKNKNQQHLTQRFFQLLDLLPARHIVHDVAVGLQLPEANKNNSWTYIAPHDKQLHQFNSALTAVFRDFDSVSLSGLHERAGAGAEIKATTGHMRGYGDHMREDSSAHYRELAKMARPTAMLQ